MRNFTIAGKGTSKNRKLAHIPIEGPLFMGIKKDHTFQPLYGADAWELNSKTMGDYSGVFPLATNNKKEEKWRKKILKKFEKLNEKRKKELLKKVKKMKK